MADLDRERAFLIRLYPGPKWKKRVNRMSDAQVLAVYLKEKRKLRTQTSNKLPNKKPDIPF